MTKRGSEEDEGVSMIRFPRQFPKAWKYRLCIVRLDRDKKQAFLHFFNLSSDSEARKTADILQIYVESLRFVAKYNLLPVFHSLLGLPSEGGSCLPDLPILEHIRKSL